MPFGYIKIGWLRSDTTAWDKTDDAKKPVC